MFLSFYRPRGAAALGAAACGLGLLSSPFAAHAQIAPAPAAADTQVKTVLDQSIAAHKALTALSATVTVQTTGAGVDQSQTIMLAFQKPGGAKATVADKTGTLARIVSDGKTLTIYDVHAKQYTSRRLPAGTPAVTAALSAAQALLPMLLARPETLSRIVGNGAKTALSADTLGGAAVDVVAVTPPTAAGGQKQTLTLSFGHDDHLLRQFAETVSATRNGQMQTLTHTETITDLSTTPTLTAADFTFTPPPGVKKAPAQAAQPPMHDPRLVPGARPFPIVAKDLSGKPLSLAQYRGKVVLMDFWATWCGPCVGEMPNVIAAYKKYHARGFDVLVISLDQNRGALTSFLKQNQMPWRQVYDGKYWQSAVPRQYGVNSIPFGLLIGRDGKIVGVEVRGTELAPAIEKALASKTAAR